MYGDLSNILDTDTVILDDTNVSGVISDTCTTTYWSLNDTQLSQSQLEDSIINISNRAVADNVIGGTFDCYDNMPTVGGTEVCNAIGALLDRSWTVNVHHTCPGY